MWGAPYSHPLLPKFVGSIKKCFPFPLQCLAPSSSGCLEELLARSASGMPSSESLCFWRRAIACGGSAICPSVEPLKFLVYPSKFLPGSIRKSPTEVSEEAKAFLEEVCLSSPVRTKIFGGYSIWTKPPFSHSPKGSPRQGSVPFRCGQQCHP